MLTSVSNQQVKQVMKLQKSNRERQKEKVFLVEGLRSFQEVPREALVKFYVTEEFVEHHWIQENRESEFPKLWQEGADYEYVSESVLKEMSDTKTPQGIVAIVRQKTYQREELLGEAILVLENLQDPGNLGTIFRTAEGAGVSGIMMSKDTVDIYNPKVVRSTMGSIFRMPFVYVDDILEGVQWLKEQGVRCYAAHLSGTSFYEQDYRRSSCFFIGNEGNGLTDKLASLADAKIKIPMMGQVESLNAATAATVLMYEALRQRIHLN